MVPHLVPEIFSLDAFCDGGAGAGAGAGIGDSRSWMIMGYGHITKGQVNKLKITTDRMT